MMNNLKDYETLQDLCLRNIVRNFEDRYAAFSNSEDANFKRKFEFLQRVYSTEILSKLFHSKRMKTHYADFLFNKYLKELHTEWLEGLTWEKITEKFAEIGCNLKTVIFDRHQKQPWQDIICHLPNLETAECLYACNDEVLKCIAKFCPNIVNIDVFLSRDVTDIGVKYLCTKENGKFLCGKLKIIDIKCTGVTEEGVGQLIKSLRSLEKIRYENLPETIYSLHKNDLTTLDEIEPYNIRSLNLLHLENETFYTDILQICLFLCPRLKTLYCPILEEKHFDSFSCLNELNTLRLDFSKYSDININLLKLKERKLEFLEIDYGSLSVQNLAESFPSLKCLYLHEVNFQNDSDINPVFSCLETCVFRYSFKLPLTIAQSIYSPVLENIGFYGCRVTANESKADILLCCERCPIKKISFIDCVVEMDFLKDILVSCRSLMYLNLEDCRLDREQELDICNFTQVLPNSPRLFFNYKQSKDYFGYLMYFEHYYWKHRNW